MAFNAPNSPGEGSWELWVLMHQIPPEQGMDAPGFNAPNPPGEGSWGLPGGAQGPPREKGRKPSENKQTAGVNGAAVIFGPEGVHTPGVVLTNSCK